VLDTNGDFMRTLEEVLQSISDALFPANLGRHRVSLDSHDCDGDTPLHVLLWRRDVEGAHMLIEAGANVNAQGDMGETPLHVAITQGLPAIVEDLLNHGASPDLRSEFGDTPRERATMAGIMDLCQCETNRAKK
jgi:uncharacterized protein